jgi:hypothetical protein
MNGGVARRALQVAALILGLAALWIAWGLLYTRFDFELLFCPFHRLFGLYCPGCGAMRALACLLRLDVYKALRYNGLMVIALPLLMIVLARVAIRYIRVGKAPPPGRWNLHLAFAAIALAFLFGVARNIPALAFLAPMA